MDIQCFIIQQSSRICTLSFCLKTEPVSEMFFFYPDNLNIFVLFTFLYKSVIRNLILYFSIRTSYDY